MTTAEHIIPRPAARLPAATAAACAHCHLPVPAGCADTSATEQFCCAGCRTVYEVVHACGLEAYYRLRDAAGIETTAAQTSGGRFAEFDDPRFSELHVHRRADGTADCEFYLTGVHCAACVWLVEKLPRVLAGVVESRLDFGRSLVHVVWDPAQVKVSQIARALDRLGYPPHPARGLEPRQARAADDRRQMVRIAIAGAVSGNAMLIGLALYAGYFNGMEPIYASLFRWVSMLLGAVSLSWPGSVFFRGAWAAIRTRTPHIDLPIALGLGVGGVAGAINTLTGRGEIYFDSITALVFLLLVGRFIQQRQQRRASDAMQLVFSLTSGSARRVRPTGGADDVPIEALQIGDAVEVRPGESIPTDGVIETGASAIDESLLTGESRPVAAGAGDAVCAGTLNLESVLRVTVRATGEQTRVGRLMKLVERCTAERGPSVRLADRISGWFVAGVTLLACGTFAWWWPIDAAAAADHAVSMLIVACPCALGLAVPLTLTVAIGRAARRGILIKGGEAMERVAQPGRIFLDKTGTLTTGTLRVVEWCGEARWKAMVAAVESLGTHPIARALAADMTGTEGIEVGGVRQQWGGIEATANQRAMVIGSVRFAEERGATLGDEAKRWIATLGGRGLTPVVVAAGGIAVAVAGVGQTVRPEAKQAVARLRSLGYEVAMLSGDRQSVVDEVADAVGIDRASARGGLTAEQKVRVVQSASAEGPTLMVGDGVNDAAALAAATAGIAMHGGAEVCLSAADVYLAKPGLDGIVELIEAARKVRRVMRRCVAASLFYNAAAITLAATGLIHPIIAAVLMPASSLTVVALVLGARYFGDERCR